MNNNVIEIMKNINIQDFLKTQDPDIVSSLLFSSSFIDESQESIELFLFEQYFLFSTHQEYNPAGQESINRYIYNDFIEKIKKYKNDNIFSYFLNQDFDPLKQYIHFTNNYLSYIGSEKREVIQEEYTTESVLTYASYFLNFIHKLSINQSNKNAINKWKILDKYSSVENESFYLTLIKEGVFTLLLYNQKQLSISSVNNININTHDDDSILKSIIVPAVSSTYTPLLFASLNQENLSIENKKQKYYNENYNNKLLLYLKSGEKDVKLFVDALSYFLNDSKISQNLLESYLIFQMMKINYIIELFSNNEIRLIERGVLLFDNEFDWYDSKSNRVLLGYVTPDDINNYNNKKEDLIMIKSTYLFFLLKVILITAVDNENTDELLDFDNYTHLAGGVYLKNHLYNKKAADRIYLDIIDAFNPYFDKEEDHIKYIKLKISIY